MNRASDAEVLTRLAAALHDERKPEPTVRAIVEQAGAVVQDAQHVSLTVRAGRDSYKSLASTSEVASRADALQYDLREGPCVEAAREGGFFRSGDVARDERWPQWGPRAAEVGVRSLLCVRLVSGEDLSGAINLYADEPGRFHDPDVVDRALLWATHAAAALASAQAVSGLETALLSRHLIGMAQGVVMERFGLSEDQSFTLLCRLSSHRNEKLRDVAAGIVQTGEIPSVRSKK